MPCGAFKPESTGTIRSARPVCFASGKARTVPSLMSVTSSTPPGLNAICRACGASAKIAMWKPGGSVRRLKSSFSTRVQESQSKQNRTENRTFQEMPGPLGQRGSGSQLFAARFARSFYIRIAKITRPSAFCAHAFRGRSVTMCCWLKTYAGRGLAFDLLYTSAGVAHSGRRYFCITAGNGARCSPLEDLRNEESSFRSAASDRRAGTSGAGADHPHHARPTRGREPAPAASLLCSRTRMKVSGARSIPLPARNMCSGRPRPSVTASMNWMS